MRPTARALTVTFTLTRRTGFPGDGLERVRSSVLARVGGMDAITGRDLTDDARDGIRSQLESLGAAEGYAIGEEVWANDILGAAERVPGTRVTLLTVQADGADVSGVAVDLAKPLGAIGVRLDHHGHPIGRNHMAVRVENTGVLNFGTFLASATVTHATRAGRHRRPHHPRADDHAHDCGRRAGGVLPSARSISYSRRTSWRTPG